MKLTGILKEIQEGKTAILIDGTSSAGKSMAVKMLKAVPFYEATDPDKWVHIDSDMFGKGKEEEKRRLKHDHPNIRKWSIENEEPGIVSGLYRKAGENVPENPYEDTYIEDTKDARAWYMAQEYKKGLWKKVIFDSINDDILKYVPNAKHVLLHAPLPILFSNIAGREASDARDPKMVLNQYLQKYEATTSKPSEDVGDPNTVLTKSGLEELLSQHVTDQKYIDDFIKKLGIMGEDNYYIKAKNLDPSKTVLVNVDQKSRDTKVASTKLQIDSEKLYELYMEWVNRVSEDLEDKSYFYPREIINAIVSILEKNSHLITERNS